MRIGGAEAPAREASALPWWEKVGRLTIGLWLGLFGAGGLAGGLVRLQGMDPSLSLRGMMTTGFALAMLALSALAFAGRFGILVPFFAFLLILSLLPDLPGTSPENVQDTGGGWRNLPEVVLAALGLIWIFGRRRARQRRSLMLVKSAGAGLLAAFLVAVPIFGQKIGTGFGMLLGPQPQPTTVLAGQRIPVVSLLSVGGEPIDLGEPGVLYVVNFWATWCAPCLQELPGFLALVEEFRDDPGVRFLAANTENLEAAELQAFLEGRDLEGLPLCKAPEEAKKLLGVKTLPLTLLVRGRTVLARYEGFGGSTLDALRLLVLKERRPEVGEPS